MAAKNEREGSNEYLIEAQKGNNGLGGSIGAWVARLVAAFTACATLHAAADSSGGPQASRVPILAAYATSHDARVLVTHEQVWVTPDRGRTWREATPKLGASSADSRFVATDFSRAGSANLLALEDGESLVARVLRSNDAGATWISQGSLPLDEVGKQYSLNFADDANGWLLAQAGSTANFSYGKLYRTRDAGQSWRELPPPPIAGRVLFKNALQGVLMGGAARTQLFVTNDGGETWRAARLPGAALMAGTTTLQDLQLDAQGEIAVSVSRKGASEDMPTAQRYVMGKSGQWQRERREATRSTLALDREVVEQIDTRGESDVRLSIANDELIEVRGNELLTLPLPDALRRSNAEQKAAVQTTTRGFDACEAPTVAQMQNWKTNSPYGWTIIYLGGNQRACPQNNLNAAWVTSIFGQGWRVVPTWVGPQSPSTGCGGCSQRFSTNATTARQQGRDQAVLAVAAAANIGLPVPSIIYYDLEAYTSHTAAEEQFVMGWTEELAARGHKSGLYSNGTYMANFDALAIKPDTVWIAKWYSTRPATLPSANTIFGLSDGIFAGKRLWQYLGDVNVTYGGLTIAIDENVSNGLTTAPGAPPAVPAGLNPGTATSPGPTLATLSPVLGWTAVSGATQYGVAVRDLTTNTLITDTTVTGASFTQALVAGRQYRWNVNACNGVGCSAYPAAVYFTAPSAVNGVCGSVNGAILDAKPTTNLCSAGTASTVSGAGGWTWSCNGLFTGTSASCSAEFSGNVAPAVPTGLTPGSLTSPGPTLGSKTVAFKWNAMPRAARYEIAVRDMTTNVLVVDTSVTTNSYSKLLTGNRPYRWNLRACTVNNVCSDYTARYYFKTPN
jgi:photosystem II stability/assembly factor-like uncharacterized protein